MQQSDNKGYMNTHASKSFQRIYQEFIDTILAKYCGPDKDVCSLGCYNDDLVDQIEFKSLTLVDKEFGPCKYTERRKDGIFPSWNEDTLFALTDKQKVIQYYECSFKEFFEQPAKYDVIIMSTVIEHITSPRPILESIKQRLKPGGFFIMTYPNGFAPNRLLGWQMGILVYPDCISNMDRTVGHVKMYGPEALTRFRRHLDLIFVERIGIMFKPLPHALMTKYFSDDLDKFIELGYELGQKACSYIGGVFRNG